MRISDWSSDVCSSDLRFGAPPPGAPPDAERDQQHEHHDQRQLRARDHADRLGRADSVIHDRPRFCVRSAEEIGSASCRERVCQYGWIPGVAVPLQQKQILILSNNISTELNTKY